MHSYIHINTYIFNLKNEDNMSNTFHFLGEEFNIQSA